MTNDKYDRHELAAKLRQLRKLSGLSTYRVAERTGLSQSTVSRIERGRTSPSSADVCKLLNVLKINPNVASSLLATARRIDGDTSLETNHPNMDQEMVRELEAYTNNRKSLSWTVLPGQLQTPEYMARVHAALGVRERLRDFIGLRLHRQAASYGFRDPTILITSEEALRRPVLPLPEWVDLLRSIKARLRFRGVELGVVPTGVVTDIVGQVTIFGQDVALFDCQSPVNCKWDNTSIEREHTKIDAAANLCVWGGEVETIIDNAIDSLARTC